MVDRSEVENQDYARSQECPECGGKVTEFVDRERKTGEVRHILYCDRVGCYGQREVPQSVLMERAGAQPLPGF